MHLWIDERDNMPIGEDYFQVSDIHSAKYIIQLNERLNISYPVAGEVTRIDVINTNQESYDGLMNWMAGTGRNYPVITH